MTLQLPNASDLPDIQPAPRTVYRINGELDLWARWILAAIPVSLLIAGACWILTGVALALNDYFHSTSGTQTQPFNWGWLCVFVFVWMCAAAFVANLIDTSLVQEKRVRKLCESGRAVHGIIIDKRTANSEAGPPFYVTAAYKTIPSGHLVNDQEITVPRENWLKFNIGDKVTVLYDPQKPSLHTVWELSGYALQPAASPSASTLKTPDI